MSNNLTGLSLAEFTGLLMAETYEAVLNTWRYQKERAEELEAALQMTDEALWAAHHNEAGLDRFLETLLGPAFRGLEGDPYTPPSAEAPEAPAVLRILGIALEPEDYTPGEEGCRLNPQGSEKIRAQGRQRMCGQFRAMASELMRTGLPGIRVHQGRILTKLHCSTSSPEASPEGKRRLQVTPSAASQAFALNKRLNLSSELEIHFTIE